MYGFLSTDSTISAANHLVHKDVDTCQGIGVCLGGSALTPLSFPDPGVCDEKTTCPRVYVTSSTIRSNTYTNICFKGMASRRRPGYARYDFQRPALYKNKELW